MNKSLSAFFATVSLATWLMSPEAAVADPDVARSGLRNPERGWRFEIRIGLEPDEKPPARDNWPFPRYAHDGVTVAQAYCYLTRYCDRDLPQSKLDALQADFDRARRDGVKFLLRFAYETGMSRIEGPYLPRILAHIAQLGEIVNRNADVIYCLQIGWVGAWGELHASRSGIEKDPDQLAQVVSATLDMLPTNRCAMIRYMTAREKVLQKLGGRGDDRIGFCNDSTLAGFIEGGSFIGHPEQMEKTFWGDLLWGKYGEKGNYQYDTVTRVSRYAPVDGEMYWASARIAPQWDGALSAILRFREHRYTTFSVVHGNSDLDRSAGPGAIDRWRATPVTPELLAAYGVDCDPDYFAGVPYRSAYDFIRDHLGYRLVVKAVRVADGVASVTVHNYGFAAPVNPRPVHFAVLTADGAVRTRPVGFDSRRFAAGEDVTVAGDSPALGTGDRLALWLPDAMMCDRPEYAIRLAGGVEIVERDGKVLNVLK